MSKYFKIEGYWKDDKSEFSDYIVKEYNDVEENESDDDLIFFYGMGVKDLEIAVKDGNETMSDFVITTYEEINWDNR